MHDVSPHFCYVSVLLGPVGVKALAVKVSRTSGRSGSHNSLVGFNPP